MKISTTNMIIARSESIVTFIFDMIEFGSITAKDNAGYGIKHISMKNRRLELKLKINRK